MIVIVVNNICIDRMPALGSIKLSGLVIDLETIRIASKPVKRNTAIALLPGGVESAQMVS